MSPLLEREQSSDLSTARRLVESPPIYRTTNGAPEPDACRYEAARRLVDASEACEEILEERSSGRPSPSSAVPCFASARDGDPTATRAVVEALRPRVSRMAVHYARRTGEDPDDLVQEAWVGLLEALPALDTGIGQPDQYLLQRARWRVLDTIKRARVRRCLPLEDAMADAMPAPDQAPASTACVSEFTDSLKDTQRAVLGCLLDGLTWREAGSALGFTSANVAYHVRQIRRRYEEWSDEPCFVD